MQYIDYFKRFNCSIKYNQKSLSLFQSGGKIRYVIYPQETHSIKNIIQELDNICIPYTIVGNCSNILISDLGYKGAFICTKSINRCAKINNCIYSEAGALLSKIVSLAKEEGLSGIEELIGIPGTIGGAVAMNAGAFNREICDLIDFVDILIDGKYEQVKCADLLYSYRHSKILETKIVVLGVMLKLKEDNKLAVQARMNKYMDFRRKLQPAQASLGSVFKKANDISAGYYIEKAGLKGMQVGNAMISNKHANFIINLGGATSTDFIKLANLAQSKVDKEFKVRLQYEVILI